MFLSRSRQSEPFTWSISETEENPVALAVCTSKPVGLRPFFFLQNGYYQLDHDHPSSSNKKWMKRRVRIVIPNLHANAAIAKVSALGTMPVFHEHHLFCFLSVSNISPRNSFNKSITTKNKWKSNSKDYINTRNQQSNLFKRHLWQNFMVHSFSPFLFMQDAAKSMVFCRHFSIQ